MHPMAGMARSFLIVVQTLVGRTETMTNPMFGVQDQRSSTVTAQRRVSLSVATSANAPKDHNLRHCDPANARLARTLRRLVDIRMGTAAKNRAAVLIDTLTLVKSVVDLRDLALRKAQRPTSTMMRIHPRTALELGSISMRTSYLFDRSLRIRSSTTS